jgi:hypothetical protein
MNVRTLLGIGFILIGFFWDSIPSPKILGPTDSQINYNKMLDLEKPSDKNFQELKDIKTIVSGPDQEFDREIIAVFHNEMGKRLKSYTDVTTVNFERYYYDSAKTMFSGRVANKYKDLGQKIQDVISTSLGENEAIITKEEMQNLAEKMRAIAWILLN